MELEISLNDLRFYAYHGVMEEERKNGNEFIVSLSIYIPFDEGLREDNIESTISYSDLYEIVSEEMKIPHNLLEKVALSIKERVTHKFPEILKGNIKIEKVRPPIPGMLGTASITLNF